MEYAYRKVQFRRECDVTFTDGDGWMETTKDASSSSSSSSRHIRLVTGVEPASQYTAAFWAQYADFIALAAGIMSTSVC